MCREIRRKEIQGPHRGCRADDDDDKSYVKLTTPIMYYFMRQLSLPTINVTIQVCTGRPECCF
jgi:hypothetical protein